MQVEDVAGVRFAPRRAAEEQRQLAVCRRVLREVIVDRQRVASGVAEVLADAAAAVRGDELHGCGVGRACNHHRRVVHGSVLDELVDHLRDRRLLLADGDVDAVHVAAALVDDGVDGHRGLAGLAVADDQLALAATDRDHRVDRLDAGLERLLHRLAIDDAGRLQLDAAGIAALDRSLAVHRMPERIHDAAEERVAHGNLGDAPRAADLVALLDELRLAHDGGADVVLFQVQREAVDAVRELDELAGLHLVEPVDARDAVARREDHSRLTNLELLLVIPDLLADDVADLRRADLHAPVPPGRTLGFSGPLLTDSGKLRPEAAVPHRAVDVEHDATEQLRVDGGGDHDLGRAAESLRQLRQLRLLGGAQWNGRADADARAADLRVDQRLVRLRDLRQDRQPIAFGEELHQVRHRRRDAERTDHPGHDSPPRTRVDRGVERHGAQAWLLEGRSHGGQLLAGVVERPRLACQLEHCTRVSSGEAPGHEACLTDSTKSRTKRDWSSAFTASWTSAVAWRIASSTISLRTARRADSVSCSATRRASARMRSAASRPCDTRRARASSAVASRSALSRSRMPGSASISRAICARSSSASRCARLPASRPSRRRSVRSRKYSRIGPARNRTSTNTKMVKLIAGKSRSAIEGSCIPCSTSDRPSHDRTRDLAREGADVRAEGPARGGDLLGDAASHLGEHPLRVVGRLRDQLLLLRLGAAQDVRHLALRLAPRLLEGGLVLVPQLLDLGLELTRRGHLTLGALRTLRENPQRRVEPETLQRQPQRHEQGGLDDEAVVELQHAVRQGFGRDGRGVPLLLGTLGMNLEGRGLGWEGRDLAILLGALRVNGRPHVALPLEHDSFLDHEARRRDVAKELSRRPDLETLSRGDVTGHTTLDHDRVADDLRVHDGALSDRQRLLRGDLTLDLALDANGPFERELPDHAAPLPQERIASTADVLGHGSTPLPIPRSDVAYTRRAGRADGGRQQRTPIVSLSILPEYRHRLLRACFEPEHGARAPAAGPGWASSTAAREVSKRTLRDA